MNILPGALPITHAPDPVMAARPERTPAPPVAALQTSAGLRNDTGGQPDSDRGFPAKGEGFPAKSEGRAGISPPPDPDRPTGPPPAFEANLLDTERERRLNAPYRQDDPPIPAANHKPERKSPTKRNPATKAGHDAKPDAGHPIGRAIRPTERHKGLDRRA